MSPEDCVSKFRVSEGASVGYVSLLCQRVRGVAQFGSASGLGPEGRRFESYRPDQVNRVCHMHYARIFQRVKDPSQSGMKNVGTWSLVFDLRLQPYVEPLMGWVGSQDTQHQVSLSFNTREEAISYALKAGINFRIEDPQPSSVQNRVFSYAKNFSANRKILWTH